LPSSLILSTASETNLPLDASMQSSKLPDDSLASARAALLKRMEKVVRSGSGGPGMLRTLMAELKPEEIGLTGIGDDAVLNHF
jgi:hypothetical protein